MGRICEIETLYEGFERKIALCVTDICANEIDLRQSERCLDRCDNEETEHWEICVAVHEKELRKNREQLERLKIGLKQMNIREHGRETRECGYRN